MKKTILIILALVLVLALGLAGCSEYSYGPIDVDESSLSAKVESNGGMVAKHGNYLYFVNGVGSATMDNKFGEVVRGAIMRYTLDGEGAIVEDSLVTVVPKVVFSGYNDIGFAIFGEWLYYVSPSVKVDKKGNRITTIVDFYRVKLDGTDTEKIIEVDGSSVPYVFTKDAIVYYKDYNIYSVDLNADDFEAKVIAEDVSGYMFPEVQDYDANDTVYSPAEYIYYSVADEDSYETANYLYAIRPDGTCKTEIINPTTYTQDSDEYRLRVSVTPVKIENNMLFYNKTYVENGSAIGEGLYAGLYAYPMYNWGDEFSFDVTKEIKVAVKKVTTLYAVDQGIVLGGDGTGMSLYCYDANGPKINAVSAFSTTITVLSISDVVKTEDALTFRAVYTRGTYDDMYTYKFTFKIEDGIYSVNTEDLEQAVKLTATDSTATYLAAEQVGDYFYFQNKWGYVSRVKVGDLDEEPIKLGKMTTADQEAYDKEMEDAE